jgi:hypothetical protein
MGSQHQSVADAATPRQRAQTHEPHRESIAIDGKQDWQDLATDIQLWMGVAGLGDVDITLGRSCCTLAAPHSS